jgi:hypothetical protein
MVKDYQVVSPCLEGILCHESVEYEGIKRPPAVAKILDKPATHRSINPPDFENRRVIEEYFHDLYGVLMKKLSQYAMQAEPPDGEAVKLQAMLQEFIKVKKLLAENI